jgi:hypothetical protein
MNEIRQHIPSFIDGVDPLTIPFETVAELLDIPFVKNFIDGMAWPFYRFSFCPDISALMAEYQLGQHWFVVGFIRDPLPGEPLPIWQR